MKPVACLRAFSALTLLVLTACQEEAPYSECLDLPVYESWAAADPGQWRRVLKGENYSAGLQMAEPATGYAIRYPGLFKTVDAGASWRALDTASSLPAWKVRFPSAQVGYLLAEGILLRSADGGKTWTRRQGDAGLILDFQFLDANNGWIAHNGTLSRTQDGGKTWKGVHTVNAGSIRRIHFLGSDRGWLVATVQDVDRLLATLDGGKTWKEIQPAGTNSLLKVHFADKDKGWLMTWGSGGLLRTRDGGQTWERRSPENAELNAWALLDAQRVFVAGRGGLFARTTDGGETWQSFAGGWNTPPNEMHFADANRGWATGEDGVFRTADGGATWTRVGNFRAFTLDFSDGASGWLGTADGTVLRTSDGGSRWDLRRGRLSPLGLHFVNAATGFMSGDRGLITRTVDGGATWSVSKGAGAPRALRAIFFSDMNTGWAVGDTGTVVRTTDGGATWLEGTAGSATLRAVRFADASNGWAVGDGGALFRSTNGGASWIAQASGTPRDLHALSVVDAATAYATGDEAVIKTHDGGRTWSRVTPHYPFVYTAVHFEGLTGYVAGGGPGLRVSGAIPEARAQSTVRAGWGGGALEKALVEKARGSLEKSLAGFFHSVPCPADTGAPFFRGLFRTNDGGQTWVVEKLEGNPIWKVTSQTREIWPGLHWAAWTGLHCRSGRCIVQAYDGIQRR